MQPIRILFQSHNRRGLGHLMRGMNLAQAIRALAPTADIMFYTRSQSASIAGDQGFRFFLEPADQGTPHWPDVMQAFAPDVVVYDTLLPKDEREIPQHAGPHTVYIMRKTKPERQQEIFANPLLQRAELVLIPHTPEEFGYTLPALLETKSMYVGPIVRMPDPVIQERLRGKYQLDAGDFLLVSTVGGGGFAEQARAFFATVFAAHQQLHTCLPNLRHLVIQGPNFTDSLPALPGMTVIEQEPDMVSLLACADLVIAEGGYNTVNEIRVVKTPAIFLPSMRNFDDQEERVRLLEAAGLAFVFSDGATDAVAQQIADICCSPKTLEGIRTRYRDDAMHTGNLQAAEQIVRLATC